MHSGTCYNTTITTTTIVAISSPPVLPSQHTILNLTPTDGIIPCLRLADYTTSLTTRNQHLKIDIKHHHHQTHEGCLSNTNMPTTQEEQTGEVRAGCFSCPLTLGGDTGPRAA